MSKENRIFDLEERLIDFVKRLIRSGGFLSKTKAENHIPMLTRMEMPKRRISFRFYSQYESIP